MANAVNSGFAKCFIFFMAVVILVQGVVYLGLSIWGFTLRTCKDQPTDIQAKPFQFAIDLIYFTDESCGNPKVTISTTTPIEQQQDYELDVVDWVKSFMVTNRFFIFLITYTVISALWIVTSFLVLATMCGRLTKVVSAVIYWPWFLVVIAGSILDAVATGYFIKDIVNTTSADEMFTYIGIEVNDPNVMSVLRTFDPYFVTPSIIMTCISSRVVIIWLLNIFGCSFCLSMSTLLAKSNSAAKVKATSAQPAQQAANYYGANLTQPQQQQQQQPQPAQMQERKYEQTPRQLSYIEPVPVPMQQQQQQRQQPPQRQQSTPQPQSPQVTENIMVEAQIMASAPPANDVNQNNRASMGPAVNTTYRSTDAHPDRLDYPRSSTPEVRVLTPQPQFAVESPLNTRYSDAFQFQQQQQPQRVSDELRSQLPWSYTSMLAKPQVPRKPTAYPDIPEADYNDAPAPAQPVIQSNNDGTAYSRW